METKKTLIWLLPKLDIKPIGGYKIAYEYANKFVQDGYDVHIVYPRLLGHGLGKGSLYQFLRVVKNLPPYIATKIMRRDFSPKWFELDKRIHCEYSLRFKTARSIKKHGKQGAKIIATAIRTAFDLAEIKFIQDKNKFYFIQDFENWGIDLPNERVYESYKLPLNKITIAPWLVQKVESVGSTAALIENGFDFEYFKLTNPIEYRSPYEIALLYHHDDRKRCVDSIAALKIVKEKIPELHVAMFGAPEKPQDLPDYYAYYKSPDKETHNKVYNNAAIFVAASRAEGMALPPAESMICGCALVCTDIPGFAVYAKKDQTALMSPAFDVEELAKNILRLIQDNELRIQIAKTGNEFIQQFTWERAYSKFKTALGEY